MQRFASCAIAKDVFFLSKTPGDVLSFALVVKSNVNRRKIDNGWVSAVSSRIRASFHFFVDAMASLFLVAYAIPMEIASDWLFLILSLSLACFAHSHLLLCMSYSFSKLLHFSWFSGSSLITLYFLDERALARCTVLSTVCFMREHRNWEKGSHSFYTLIAYDNKRKMHYRHQPKRKREEESPWVEIVSYNLSVTWLPKTRVHFDCNW